MTDDPAPDPDRSPPVRPVRVARFDGVPVAGHDRDGETCGRRVAAFDGLDDPGASPTRVAGFEGLDAAPATPAPVAAFDTVAAPRPERRGGGGDQVADRAPAADRSAAGGLSPDAALLPDAPLPPEAPLPPDGPLPPGRRRGARGARVGRLGPNAPDPDVPEPEADPVAVAREICLRLLTDRARTRQELAQALARKGVPDEAAATVLDRFDEVGLIDDAAFAGQWVRSRHAHRGLGRRAIAVELRRKGVADDVAGEALAEVDAEAEARRARELVDRKLRTVAVDTPEQRTAAARRLVGMLARKGYGAATAYRAVREALAERGAEVDELGAEPVD